MPAIQKKRILGLDIGSTAIKVVQSSGNNRNWRFGSAQVPDGVVTGNIINSSKLLAASVRKAMANGRIHGGSAALSIGGSDVIIRSAVYPRMTADQLRQNVIDEITGYLSVKPELYHIDYKVTEIISEGATQQYRVMIAAVPKSIVSPYIQALAQAGVKVTSVDVAANAKEKLINALVGTVQHFAVIDMGMNSTVIDTYQNNRYFINKVSQMCVNGMTQELAATQQTDQLQALDIFFGGGSSEAGLQAVNHYADQIAFEAMRVFDYFRSRNNQQPVAHVYLCGGGAAIPGITSLFHDKLDMPVTNLAEVLSALFVKNDTSGKFDLSTFANAVGVTLTEVDA